MTQNGFIASALTGPMLRLARLAVRFGGKRGGSGGFRAGPLGRLGDAANRLLVRHRAWERRLVSEQLGLWRASRSLAPVRRLRRRLNIQMSDRELGYILSVLEQQRPCSLLIFGMGNDSILWYEANRGGRTLFIEDDVYWDRVIRERHPSLRSVHVLYGTRAANWRADLERPQPLLLPQEVGLHAWDIVLVDGPAACKPEKPGRIQSVLAARRLVADGGAILVHDCDRHAEHAICGGLLGHLVMSAQIDTLRHYASEADALDGRRPVRSPAHATWRETRPWQIAAFGPRPGIARAAGD